MAMPNRRLHACISLWLKLPYTLFVTVMVPVYWANYGPANFLWFSDLALLVTCAALWLENPFLASMMAVAVLLPEAAWNVGFFAHLLTGHEVIPLAGYMFDTTVSPFLRSLSLFHVFLPVVLVYLVYRLGYDTRAWKAQTVLAWIVVPLSYAASNPVRNVNWAYGPGHPQTWVSETVYVALMMVFLVVVIYLPTDWLLRRLFAPPRRKIPL